MRSRDPKLSILHLLAPAAYGGMESVVEALAAGQQAAGDRVAVGAVIPEGLPTHPFLARLAELGIDTILLDAPSRAYAAERRRVRALLEARAVDVLHTHGHRPTVLHGPVARAGGVSTVATIHGFTGSGPMNRVYHALQRRALRRFDAVIAVSDTLRAELVTRGVPREKLHTVRNAWTTAPDTLSRKEARRALGLPPEEIVVGWIGRLSPEKAPDIAIRAFAALTQTESRLSIVGDGPRLVACRVLAEESGLAARVRWHGAVSRAGLLMRAFDAVVMSSWSEGTPMVLLEAMAAGVPIATTAVGGVPEFVSQEEAILVPPGDVESLARAIEDLLADRARAEARARAAAARLARDFSVERWVRRHREVYGSLARSRTESRDGAGVA